MPELEDGEDLTRSSSRPDETEEDLEDKYETGTFGGSRFGVGHPYQHPNPRRRWPRPSATSGATSGRSSKRTAGSFAVWSASTGASTSYWTGSRRSATSSRRWTRTITIAETRQSDSSPLTTAGPRGDGDEPTWRDSHWRLGLDPRPNLGDGDLDCFPRSPPRRLSRRFDFRWCPVVVERQRSVRSLPLRRGVRGGGPRRTRLDAPETPLDPPFSRGEGVAQSRRDTTQPSSIRLSTECDPL